MAILSGFNTGSAPVPLNGTTTEAFKLGASIRVPLAGAASASSVLPVDANGVKYGNLLLTCSAACWFNFNTAGDAATVAAPNILLPVGVALIVVPPLGTLQISAIQDGATTGSLGITGIM